MKGFIIVCTLLAIVWSKSLEEKPKKASFRGHKLISVTVDTPLQAEYLRQLQNDPHLDLDFWKEPRKGDVHIHITPQNEKRFFRSLDRAGLQYTTIQQDIQSLIDTEERRKHMGSRNLHTDYLNLAEIDTFLNDLAANYPSRIRRFNLNQVTHENNPIWGVQVSKNLNDDPKPAIVMEGLTHAREHITGSVVLGIIENLVKENPDQYANATHMLNWFDWYFFPVHNPDGYKYSLESNRLWRKNRRPNAGSSCIGVDLNRNWDAAWSESSSSDPCYSTYHGPGVLSEPETNAVDTYVTALMNSGTVKAFISMHCYGQYILVPWGYKTELPSDYDESETIALAAKGVLQRYSNTKFKVGSGANEFYIASGGSEDHFKIKGVPHNFLYELRPAHSNNGFVLPTDEIDPSIRETFGSVWKIADMIRN